MNPKVSLIIPVYKVEKYLPRCLESVAAQTYDNFETILVDDGSPDHCGKMCDEYAATHENVIVIHQENGGLSAARNSGVRAATGEYITFVDSDDYISNDYIKYLMELIQTFGADVSASGLCAFYGERYNGGVGDYSHDGCLTKIQALQAICYASPFGVSACAKMYPRNLIENNPYPEGKIHEDLATTYEILSNCQRVAYGTKKIYFYFQRLDSLMHEKLELSHLYGLEAAKQQLSFMQENYPEVVPAARFRCAFKILEYIPRIIDGTEQSRERYVFLRNEMKPYLCSVLYDSRASKTVKMRCIALMMGYVVTRIVFGIHTRLKIRALSKQNV